MLKNAYGMLQEICKFFLPNRRKVPDLTLVPATQCWSENGEYQVTGLSPVIIKLFP